MLKLFSFSLILITLVTSCARQVIESFDSSNHSIDSTQSSNALEELIAPYRLEVDSEMNDSIGWTNTALTVGKPESSLGNFAVDAVWNSVMTSSDRPEDMNEDNSIALLNFGGLRTTLNAGVIRIGNVYEVMPFDNVITVVKLSPSAIHEMLVYLKLFKGQPISNASANLSDSTAFSIRINKKEYDFSFPIYVVTSDYLAAGGDKMKFFEKSIQRIESSILIRDVLIDAISKHEIIPSIEIEGRIILQE